MSLPYTHKALVVSEIGKTTIKEQVLPPHDDSEVVVRVKSVSLNPTDWKHVDRWLEPGSSIGCDFAGDIAYLGKNVQDKGWKVGDAVAGWVRPGHGSGVHNGAFQEYVVTLPEFIWRKPTSITYEEAAPMGGVALSTAVYSLYGFLDLSFEPISTTEPLLVWAGSTGVGMYAIKLASLAGYKVVTVASARNFDLVKSLGASAVFDYKDPEVLDHIRTWVREEGFSGIKRAIDNMSENGSIETVISLLDEGGSVVILLPPPNNLNRQGRNVIHVYLGDSVNPANTKTWNLIADWNRRLPSLIESGEIEGSDVPIKVFRGGFEALPEALDYLRQGKVSGEKIVVPLD